MKKLIANKEIDVNEEGYLTDFSQWDKEVGSGLADECDIQLTDKHWVVIKYLQDKYHNEEALSIRGIKKVGLLILKNSMIFFPEDHLKNQH